jgi:hypothetical protein
MSYENGETEKFHKACFLGKRKQAREILLNGATGLIDATRSDGLAALHIVASTGSAKMCKMLLEKGKSEKGNFLFFSFLFIL